MRCDEKCDNFADISGLSAASTASDSPDSCRSLATVSVASPMHLSGAESARLIGFPRIISPLQLLGESDDEMIWCGPPSDPEDSGKSDIRAMKFWRIHEDHGKNHRDHIGSIVKVSKASRAPTFLLRENSNPLRDRPAEKGERSPELGARAWGKAATEEGALVQELGDRPPQSLGQELGARSPAELGARPPQRTPLIQPQGTIYGNNQKFVCSFLIGLEDNPEFCLVKRILGKAGCNMRRIAEECNAKVRLRGIGSGFLEGSSGREANMPLQLHVSCSDFDSYKGAVDRANVLLKDLYKHYRRYARSKGKEPPDVKVALEEVRRDDLGYDILKQKAERSPSQRERDRRARQLQRQREQEHEREHRESRSDQVAQMRNPFFWERDIEQRLTLPDGAPIPTTPAGRRNVAKAGGAEYAAIVSAAAREAEKLEREHSRQEREERQQKETQDQQEKKRQAAERAATMARRGVRNSIPSVKAQPSFTERSESHVSLTHQAIESGEVGASLNWDPWADAAGKLAAQNGRKEQPKEIRRENPRADFAPPPAQSASTVGSNSGNSRRTWLI